MRRTVALALIVVACTPHVADTDAPAAPCEREWMRDFATLDDVGPGEIERRSVALEHGRPAVVEHHYDSIREPFTPSIGASLAIDEVG